MTCALIILIFQRESCNVQAWSPEISPAIAYGLSLSGLPGIANSFMITSRQPGNRIGWSCGATGFVGLVLTAADRYALCGLYGDQPILGLAYAAWGAYVFSPVVIALVFWQIPFWFPTGQYLCPRWRGFARLSWILLAICLLSIALSDGELTNNGISLSYALPTPLAFVASHRQPCIGLSLLHWSQCL